MHVVREDDMRLANRRWRRYSAGCDWGWLGGPGERSVSMAPWLHLGLSLNAYWEDV